MNPFFGVATAIPCHHVGPPLRPWKLVSTPSRYLPPSLLHNLYWLSFSSCYFTIRPAVFIVIATTKNFLRTHTSYLLAKKRKKLHFIHILRVFSLIIRIWLFIFNENVSHTSKLTNRNALPNIGSFKWQKFISILY